MPTFLGARTILDQPLEELVERIDWSPFFTTWELAGQYPRILSDPTVGAAATELFRDAQRLLDRIVAERLLQANAAVGFWPAASTPDDDIEVYADAGRTTVLTRLHTLRQQMAKTNGRPDVALADYTAPVGSGVADHVGLFAVTAGVGLEELRARFMADNDDYGSIMAAALADRLAEAFAELLHERVRRELWGYAPDEALDNDALIAERYQGIRPAPGYPSCPDHTEKRTIFELLDAERTAGITSRSRWRCCPARRSAATTSGTRRRATSVSAASTATSWRTTPGARAGPWSEAERWLAPNLMGGILG